MLTTGDGAPSLKWGSTNAYTRDAAGQPIYNWTIVDKIFDTYKAPGITPFVEIGFMPEALSTHPEPYQHNWPKDFDTGWTYPPKNYHEWSDLIYRWVRHTVDRYGATEVAKWEWEVLEPARYLLLARNRRRLPEILRLHRRGSATRAAGCACRWTSKYESSQRASDIPS